MVIYPIILVIVKYFVIFSDIKNIHNVRSTFWFYVILFFVQVSLHYYSNLSSMFI